eukprot:TRINITY_DN8608_c0_g1_i1.p1 TRINITY_DN8608_c0_g1~~TRINITY_DN8608_c0_g1_i1.p1  ORF type:complete len:192 (+),score=21.98 TRINITY_DN8608_c0_g1_i1:84-578(+)
MSRAGDDELRQLEHQREVLEKKKQEMGGAFYGYQNNTTEGFNFGTMMSRKHAWENPAVYHSLNASGCMGSCYGLWFFFRSPVHNKLYHVSEMLRRALVGTLWTFPVTFGLAWYLRERSLNESNQQLRERGDSWRKDYMAQGGAVMQAPPNPTYSGPQGIPNQKN